MNIKILNIFFYRSSHMVYERKCIKYLSNSCMRTLEKLTTSKDARIRWIYSRCNKKYIASSIIYRLKSLMSIHTTMFAQKLPNKEEIHGSRLNWYVPEKYSLLWTLLSYSSSNSSGWIGRPAGIKIKGRCRNYQSLYSSIVPSKAIPDFYYIESAIKST